MPARGHAGDLELLRREPVERPSRGASSRPWPRARAARARPTASRRAPRRPRRPRAAARASRPCAARRRSRIPWTSSIRARANGQRRRSGVGRRERGVGVRVVGEHERGVGHGRRHARRARARARPAARERALLGVGRRLGQVAEQDRRRRASYAPGRSGRTCRRRCANASAGRPAAERRAPRAPAARARARRRRRRAARRVSAAAAWCSAASASPQRGDDRQRRVRGRPPQRRAHARRPAGRLGGRGLRASKAEHASRAHAESASTCRGQCAAARAVSSAAARAARRRGARRRRPASAYPSSAARRASRVLRAQVGARRQARAAAVDDDRAVPERLQLGRGAPAQAERELGGRRPARPWRAASPRAAGASPRCGPARRGRAPRARPRRASRSAISTPPISCASSAAAANRRLRGRGPAASGARRGAGRRPRARSRRRRASATATASSPAASAGSRPGAATTRCQVARSGRWPRPTAANASWPARRGCGVGARGGPRRGSAGARRPARSPSTRPARARRRRTRGSSGRPASREAAARTAGTFAAVVERRDQHGQRGVGVQPVARPRTPPPAPASAAPTSRAASPSSRARVGLRQLDQRERAAGGLAQDPLAHQQRELGVEQRGRRVGRERADAMKEWVPQGTVPSSPPAIRSASGSSGVSACARPRSIQLPLVDAHERAVDQRRERGGHVRGLGHGASAAHRRPQHLVGDARAAAAAGAGAVRRTGSRTPPAPRGRAAPASRAPPPARRRPRPAR